MPSMLIPTVTETPLRLEPTTRDTFGDAARRVVPAPSAAHRSAA
jgi:hypothetical protein